jgi:hypothetical protein
LTQVQLSHLFEFDVSGVRGINVDGLTLSVERMDDMIDVIVKTLIRKVLLGTFHNLTINLIILNIPVDDIIEKVIMGQRIVVEELNEDQIIVNESACAEWISKSLNWHCVIVNA